MAGGLVDAQCGSRRGAAVAALAGGAPLTRGLSRAPALAVISSGRNTMPKFRESFSDQELRDLAAYVAERLATAN
jgi:hypothetical protein